MIFLLFLLLFFFFPPLPLAAPQCQPPHDCSVHVFRVRLSQKPEGETAENTTFSDPRNQDSIYEIRGGKEMTPKLAAEIISSMGKDADPRLKEKINNKEFYWKAVGPNEKYATVAFQPPPPPPKKQPTATTPAATGFRPSDFPVLLVSLLLCVGIFLGILLTAICLFMANMQKEPQFDRSSVIIYNKVGGANNRRPMLPKRREQQIELIERASVAPSMSSGTRIGPAWRNGNAGTTSRHISL
ncbi:Protein CBG19740 [Caenorhabditis briggsae]|uniref:Uncharacterized protein n=2 Tax=Caenorhabditis briggsae TaxID=6238 RepID=A0AAE9J570_CAEBR|nr:Protein CBG19740 [Caenorhabditis briggsae]ULU14296.1 hypothetical protein L3Y34_016667 [Caenorhabditis briggsae]UMM15243.1 hypothetical protein L5515_002748 [Caenorhabditis briggsae]CAP36973.1 Protein CBG19740 [Caenorhabditis briggsae]